MKLRLRPGAIRDLDAISDFTEQRWGTSQAKRYARQLEQSFNDILSDPRRGQDIGASHPGYRKLRVGSHIVFYQCRDGWVEVVRILHARMDFLRHL